MAKDRKKEFLNNIRQIICTSRQIDELMRIDIRTLNLKYVSDLIKKHMQLERETYALIGISIGNRECYYWNSLQDILRWMSQMNEEK